MRIRQTCIWIACKREGNKSQWRRWHTMTMHGDSYDSMYKLEIGPALKIKVTNTHPQQRNYSLPLFMFHTTNNANVTFSFCQTASAPILCKGDSKSWGWGVNRCRIAPIRTHLQCNEKLTCRSSGRVRRSNAGKWALAKPTGIPVLIWEGSEQRF